MHVSKKTHQGMLPQSPALEPVSADTLTGQHETGHRRPAGAPGVQHGRGETAETQRHSEAPKGDEEAGREAHPYVFVIDKHGKPLMPCHPARARKLLRSGRAAVAHRSPLVIRLRDRAASESEVAELEIGIDPGSKFTGIALFAAKQGVRQGRYAIEVSHRGDAIRGLLKRRAAHRRRRRTANLRYRAPRFSNRRRPAKWQAPSLRHRVETTMSWVSRLQRWAPVAAMHVERAAFDAHLLQNPEISGIEYQQGTLVGTEIRQYLLAKWHRKCAYCDAAGRPLNIDHIFPRARGGSSRISNLTLACAACNQDKGARDVREFVTDPARLAKILRQAKTSLRDAAAVTTTRWALWRALTATGMPVHVATGGRTKWNRLRTGLPKTHAMDALHVGEMKAVTAYPATTLTVKCTGRGSYRRTSPDANGFPRLRRGRTKSVHGFQTGDYVRAIVPAGKKKAGIYVGRVAVRKGGTFNIASSAGLAEHIGWRYCRLVQRADGYQHEIKHPGGERTVTVLPHRSEGGTQTRDLSPFQGAERRRSAKGVAPRSRS